MTTPRTKGSTFKGVHWQDRSRKWFAQISVNGTKVYLGIFETAEAAHQAYLAAAADRASGTFWTTPRATPGGTPVVGVARRDVIAKANTVMGAAQ
jgi:hypothetical protein